MSTNQFLVHSDLELPVKIKISCVEGLRIGDDLIEALNRGPYGSVSSGLECFITAQLFSDGSPVGIPIQTSLRSFKAGDEILFNEWITFPALYRDILLTSSVAITIWAIDHSSNSSRDPLSPNHTFITAMDGYVLRDPLQQNMSKFTSLSNPRILISDIPNAVVDSSSTSPSTSSLLQPSLLPIGGTCIPLFSDKGILRLGTWRLYTWRNAVADGSIRSVTPHRHPLFDSENGTWIDGQVSFVDSVEKKNALNQAKGNSKYKTQRSKTKASGSTAYGGSSASGNGSKRPGSSSLLRTFILPRPLTLVSAASSGSFVDSSVRSVALALALPPSRLSPSSRLALQHRIREIGIQFVRSGSGPSRWLDKLSLLAVSSLLISYRRQRNQKNSSGSGFLPPSMCDNVTNSNTGWAGQSTSPLIAKALQRKGANKSLKSNLEDPLQRKNPQLSSFSSLSSMAAISSLSLSEEPLTVVIDFPPFLFPVVYFNPSLEQERTLEHESTNALFSCPDIHSGTVSLSTFASHTNTQNIFHSSSTPSTVSSMNMHETVLTATTGSASEMLLSELLTRVGAPPKPTLVQIDRIREALSKPILTPLTAEEKALLFTFRHSLVDDPAALSKLLRAVDWNDASSAKSVIRLLSQWSPLKPPQALELLMGEDCFSNVHIRAHAVTQLGKASNSEISSYLLMLVQALRYEVSSDAPLAKFLIERTSCSIELASSLYWYLKVETREVSSTPSNISMKERERQNTMAMSNNSNNSASSNSTIINNDIFNKVFADLLAYLSSPLHPECHALFKSIEEQETTVKQLTDLCVKVKSERKTDKKSQMLVELLSSSTNAFGSMSHPDRTPFNLPLVPNLALGQLHPKQCKAFKSAMAPLLLNYHVREVLPSIVNDDLYTDSGSNKNASDASSKAARQVNMNHMGRQAPFAGGEYNVIFKEGDDLRQDQLVVQLISLIDVLLKHRNMDMRLTPYKVLAVDQKVGFVEFVAKNYTLRDIQEDPRFTTIANFLQFHNPTLRAMATAMNNYTYSLAGYCVITYILAVGDRHLENIMVTVDGHLLHIDFGWCFGFDPKPAPPPIRVTKDMMAVIGNESSQSLELFRRALCDTFIVLRKNANLIITLLLLMKDANIPHLAKENPITTIRAIQNRFFLELNDDAACMELLKLFHTSFTSLFPLVTDKIHNWMSAWR